MKAVAFFFSLAYAVISPSVSELLPEPDSPSTSQVLIRHAEGPLHRNISLHRHRRTPEVENRRLQVEVESINSTSVRLKWTGGQESPEPRTFVIRYDPLGSYGRGFSHVLEGNMTFDLTALIPDTQYSGTLCEKNNIRRSNCRSFRFFTDSLDLQLEVRSSRRLLVSANWSVPGIDSFDEEIDFILTWQVKSRLTWSNYHSENKSNLTRHATGIISRHVPPFCNIAVCLQYKKSDTLWSRGTCRTVESPPGQPGPVANLQVNASENSLTLSWNDPVLNPPTGVLELFSITLLNTQSTKTTNFTFNVDQVPQVNNKRFFTAYNLESDTVYTIRISTKNENVDELNTVSREAKTLTYIPLVPRSFLAVPRNGTSVLLSWLPPEGQLRDHDDYSVTINGKRATCAEDTKVHHRCEISGLIPAKPYRFGVSACNGRRCSDEVTQSVALPSTGGMDTWIIVVMCVLFVGVFILIPLMLWKGKKLADRITQTRGHVRGFETGPIEGSRFQLTPPSIKGEDVEPEDHVYEDPADFSTKAHCHSEEEPHIYEQVLENNVTTEVGGDVTADSTYANVSGSEWNHRVHEDTGDRTYENVSLKKRGMGVYENMKVNADGGRQ